MTETITRCDVCQKIKGEGNKWMQFRPPSVSEIEFRVNIMITHFDDERWKDACSEACVMKALGEYLSQR
jgi:hypothetical protein